MMEEEKLERAVLAELALLEGRGATVHSLTKRTGSTDGRLVRKALDRLEESGDVTYVEGTGNNRRYRLGAR